ENHSGRVAIAGVASGAAVASQLSLEAPVAGWLLVAPAQIDVWPQGVGVGVAELEPPLPGLETAGRAAHSTAQSVQADRTVQRQRAQVGGIAVSWLPRRVALSTEAATERKH